MREISGLTVTFTPPVEIRSGRTVDKIVITRIIDEPGKRLATAFSHGYKRVVLWEGDAYTAAGQWTDTDVINRFREIVTNS